jgi:tetratricopeptide (TPR) repeat protein
VDEARHPANNVAAWRVAIVLITLATFWPVLTCGFGGWDDDLNVTANPWMNPPTRAGLVRYWRAPEADLYVPVTYTVWSCIASVAPRDAEGKLTAWMFHAASLGAHLIAVLCVFEILRACTRGSTVQAAIGALVFALHPVQVEVVAWVAGFKDVLAGALALAAIAIFIRRDDRTVIRTVAATILFALSMLAKPSEVVAPVIALLIELMILRRPVQRSVLALVPSFAVAAIIIMLTSRAQTAPWIAAAVPVWKRFFVAGDALAFYLAKLVWPVNLAVDYGRTPQVALATSSVWIMWLIPAALIALAVWWARRRRDALPLVAVIVFVIGVGPVLGLVPFDFQAYSTVADHYLYLGMLGPALLVCWLLTRHPNRATRIISAVAIVLLAALSFRQAWTWRDGLSVARQATRVNPRSFAWHDRAAMSLFYDHHDIDTAIASERRAVEANPSYATGWQNLGLILATAARHAEAADAYRRALGLDPNNLQARIGLANALADTGESAGAIEQYRAALQRDPNNVVAVSNLAGVLASQGKLEEAIDLYRHAILIDANFQPARQGLARAIDERAKRGSAPPAPR